jgi:hypothetical protein
MDLCIARLMTGISHDRHSGHHHVIHYRHVLTKMNHCATVVLAVVLAVPVVAASMAS